MDCHSIPSWFHFRDAFSEPWYARAFVRLQRVHQEAERVASHMTSHDDPVEVLPTLPPKNTEWPATRKHINWGRIRDLCIISRRIAKFSDSAANQMSTAPQDFTAFGEPQPVWDVAKLFPPEGQWNEFEYLALTHSTNKLVELKDGNIRVLEMPTQAHQLILEFLFDVFRAFIKPRNLGRMVVAAMRMKIREDEFREPDLLFMSAKNLHRAGNEYWDGADLVVEIVSDHPAGRTRDLKEKRDDYAAAGISEYWIVDPRERRVIVLTLDGSQYVTAGEYAPGEQAASRLLEGFTIAVTDVFHAAEV